MKERAPVRLKRGQVVLIDAGRGAQLRVERFASGAVILRNATTGSQIRAWTPKEARQP